LGELLREVVPKLGGAYAHVDGRYDDASWVGNRWAEILPRILEHLAGCAAVVRQHRSTYRPGLGKHQPESLRDHEVGAEGAQRRACLGDDPLVRQRPEPLDSNEPRLRVLPVAGVGDAQPQVWYAAAQGTE